MQRILHFTRQLGSRASSSASSPALSSTSSSTSLLNPQSTRHSTPVPRRVRRSTTSSPLPIDDNIELGDQDNSISREPPLAN